MKKIAKLFAAGLVLVMALTACGDSGEKVIERSSAPATGGTKVETAKYDGYYFTIKGVNLLVDTDVTEYLDKLGEPASYFEAASCAFEGLDKMYSYSNFEIDTYPDGKVDKISQIALKDDTVSTNEGVYIGMSETDAKAKYPNAKEDGTAIVETTSAMKLTIVFKNGTVGAITYSSKVLDAN